jgi:hypothetical protein
MDQQAADRIAGLFRESVGKLAIVQWRTRTGLAMTTRLHVAYVDTFQQDGATWVQVRDDNDISRVTAPLTDIATVRVLGK